MKAKLYEKHITLERHDGGEVVSLSDAVVVDFKAGPLNLNNAIQSMAGRGLVITLDLPDGRQAILFRKTLVIGKPS